MANSRFHWARGVFAPWCLGTALAISITADAGQDASAGASISPLTFRAATPPQNLVPWHGPAEPIAGLGRNGHRFAGRHEILLIQPTLWQSARLIPGEAADYTRLSDEIEPRAASKGKVSASSMIERSGKGDPLVGVHPTFDTSLRDPGGFADFETAGTVFSIDESLPVGGFTILEDEGNGEEAVAMNGFEPWPDGEHPTTVQSFSEASPHATKAQTMTMRPAAIHERMMQGATPAVERATTLASATPAPADATPVEIAAAPAFPRPGDRRISPRSKRPDFATLIEADSSAKEQRCLAEAIYFEARSESPTGQAAVAQVVLNRVASGLYPTTICGVVYQNRHRYRACQFSFACEGKSLRITEQDAWRSAVRVAKDVTSGRTYVSDVGGSTHYHANYVRPRWARSLEKMDVIGHHIFYKLRPGRT
jgi:spore germination cell wall hydrolase CwlJ-like protein